MHDTKADDLMRQIRAARAAASKACSDTTAIEVNARHLRGLAAMRRESRGAFAGSRGLIRFPIRTGPQTRRRTAPACFPTGADDTWSRKTLRLRQEVLMVRLRRLMLVCAAPLFLAGCANSELNARVSQMFPIRQMDALFGGRTGSPPLSPPAPADTAPLASGAGYQPAYPPESGYAPAYPPYSAAEQNRLSSD